MRNPNWIKRAIYIFLLLHTASILTLAYLAARNETPIGSLIVIVVSVAAVIGIALYLAYTLIYKGLTSYAKEL